MTMFFAKKLNKKGFTLAELLIVVAIIAVLIAVAVPIFTGSLEKSKIAVLNSAARSLKAVAVNKILADVDGDYAADTAKAWLAVAKVDDNGELSVIAIAQTSDDVSDGPWFSNSDSFGVTDKSLSATKPSGPDNGIDDFVSQYKSGSVFYVCVGLTSVDATSP